jgi:hypothetical protein
MADVTFGSLQFSEQIAFFRRKLNLPTSAWTEIWQSQHDHAFVVAGVTREDMLADFRAAIDKAISQGATLEQFRQDFDTIVAKYGWDYNGGRNWRSRVIYETNMRASYAAGRYAQLQSLKEVRPYWRYRHSDAVQHPRPLHVAWNGLVIPADDPWWLTHYPPNGWGCQCTVEGLNGRDLKRLGKSEPDKAPDDGTRTVTVGSKGPAPRTVEVPNGIDPGFGYSPGRNAWLRQQAERALEAGDANAAAQWQQMLDSSASDLGRPAQLPLDPVPGQSALPPGEMRVLDVKGLPTIVDAAVLSESIRGDQAQYLPLLLDALANPFEVWQQLARDPTTGAYRTTSTIIKAYDLGNGETVYLAIDRLDGTVIGWTTAKESAGVDDQRRGMLWWGRE